MNDPMYAIWKGLEAWLGFDGAVAFLYGGLTILIPLTLYFILKCCADFYGWDID